ncbi:hypothetical protein GCM10022200_21520 [Microbacterium awajiense]|uniref:Sugar ABC transporter substrate-binding protein n=1 Tax=Microbacterium awajiense TaxID=415214 RepID=A0ABP7AQN4_9MICO
MLAAGAAAASTAIILAGCSSAAPEAEAPEEGAELTLWISSSGAAEPIQEYMLDWAEEEGIALDIEIHPQDQYQNTVQLAMTTGNAPDVFQLSSPRNLMQAGYLLELEGLLSQELLDVYGSEFVENGPISIDGHLYGVPTTANPVRLTYNKEIFEQAGLDPEAPPTTFDELRDACEAISELDGISCFGLPLAWVALTTWILEPTISTTSDVLASPGLFDREAGEFVFTEYTPVVELAREMIEKEWAFPGASSLDGGPMLSAFGEGQIAMYIAGYQSSIVADYPEAVENWGAASVPVPDGATSVRGTFNSGGPFGAFAGTEYPAAAAAVIEELASNELAAELVQAGLALPMRSDFDAGAITDISDFTRSYWPTEADTQWPLSPAPDLEIQGETYIQVIQRLILGDEDIEGALAEIQVKYQEAYDEAVADGDLDGEYFTG